MKAQLNKRVPTARSIRIHAAHDSGNNNDNDNHNNVLELEVTQGNAQHGKAKQDKAMRVRGICANAFVVRLLLATHV